MFVSKLSVLLCFILLFQFSFAQKDDEELISCGTIEFKPGGYYMCCNDKPRPRLSKSGNPNECCGINYFDPTSNQACCDGTVRKSDGDTAECCCQYAFDPETQYCDQTEGKCTITEGSPPDDDPFKCGNKECSAGSDKCCGPHCCLSTEKCVGNSCCPEENNSCGNSCCSTESDKCCGNSCCYPGEKCVGNGCCPEENNSCGNSCCPSESDKCCGNSCCSPGEKCCGNSCCPDTEEPEDPDDEHISCGDITFKPGGYYMCCDDKPRPRLSKQGNPNECCGINYFDPTSNSACCENVIRKSDGDTAECCCKYAFDPETQYCDQTEGKCTIKERKDPSSEPEVDFNESTRVAGVSRGFKDYPEYDLIFKFDATTIEEGVISLDELYEFVDDLECSKEPSVQIKLKSDFKGKEASLQEMYPVGSILAINSRIFGRCILSNSEKSYVREDENDGFLRVKSVSGDILEHTVYGEAVTYFDMFSSYDFDIQSTIDSPFVRTIDTSERFGTDSDLQIDEFKMDITVPIIPDVLSLTQVGKASFLADISRSRIYGELDGEPQTLIELKYHYKSESELTLDLTPRPWGMKEPKALPARLSIPLRGFYLRTFNTCKKSCSAGQVTDLRVGVFVDFALLYQLSGGVRFGGKIVHPRKVDTGERIYQFIFDGLLLKEFKKLNENWLLKEPDSSGTQPIEWNINMEASGQAFIGLQPSINLGLGAIEFGLGFVIGINGEAKLDIAGDTKVMDDNALAAYNFGGNEVCKTCHKGQVDISLRISDPVILVDQKPIKSNSAYFKVVDVNAQILNKLMLVCFFKDPAYSSCGNKCCNNMSQVCDASDKTCKAPAPEDETLKCGDSECSSESDMCCGDNCCSPTEKCCGDSCCPDIEEPEPEEPELPEICQLDPRPVLRLYSGYNREEEEMSHVRGLQSILNNVASNTLDVDGLFGPGTESAVISWQNENGLDADGIVGPMTWDSLCV